MKLDNENIGGHCYTFTPCENGPAETTVAEGGQPGCRIVESHTR